MQIITRIPDLKDKVIIAVEGISFVKSSVLPVWIDAPPSRHLYMRDCNKLIRVYNFVETITEPKVIVDLIDVHNYHKNSFAKIFGMDENYFIIRKILLSRLALIDPGTAELYTVYHAPPNLYRSIDDTVPVKEGVTEPIFVKVREHMPISANHIWDRVMNGIQWSYDRNALTKYSLIEPGTIHKVLPKQYIHIEADMDKVTVVAINRIKRAEQHYPIFYMSISYGEIKRMTEYLK